MDEREQALLRRVLLWLLGLSALAAPSTFAHAPAVPPTGLAAVHTVLLVVLWVALWRRWLSVTTVAIGAIVVSTVSASVVTHGTAAAIAGDLIPIDALGNVVLPSVLAVTGVAFIVLRLRPAAMVVATVLVVHAVAVSVAAGDAARDILASQPAAITVRFSVFTAVMFGLVQVIAERRGRERDVAARRARAVAELSEHRATLYADAAHELRTPLSVIWSALDTFEQYGDRLDQEQSEELLATIRRACRRLQDRTTDVAAAGRAERERLPQLAGTLDAATVVRHTIAQLGPLLANHEVHTDLAPGVALGVTDDDLAHVTENYLSNAVKYGPHHGPITVRLHTDGGHAVLEVHDPGTSLGRAEALHVFDRGYRGTNTDDTTSGDGIGLAVVHRMVTAWGGDAGCDLSASGTTFWCTAPLATDAAEAVVTVPTAGSRPEATG